MFVVGGCDTAECATAASLFIMRKTANTSTPITWSRARAELQVPRIGLGAALMDGHLYAIGGLDTDTNNTLAVVEMLDLSSESNTWSRVRSMPTARWLLAVAAFDGRIFAVGGQTTGYQTGGAVDIVESFSPRTNSWVREASLLQARSGLGMVVVGNLLVAVGGQTAVEHIDPADRVLNSTEVFDRTMRKWEKRPSSALKQPRVAHALVALPGIIGGRATLLALGGGNAGFIHIASVEVLHVHVDVGSAHEGLGDGHNHDQPGDAAQLSLPAMPGARAGAAAGVFHNELIIAGGVDENYKVLDSTIGCWLGV
jgi:hypothetical protein